MQLRLIILPLFLIFTSCIPGHAQTADSTAFQQLTIADPTIFLWEGKYYAFGTSGRNSNNGIPVFESNDLVHWQPISSNEGFALRKGDAYGTKGFWAPQVFFLNGIFYMAYTAMSKLPLLQAHSLMDRLLKML